MCKILSYIFENRKQNKVNICNVLPHQFDLFLYIHAHSEYEASNIFQTSLDVDKERLRKQWNAQKIPV